MTVVTQNKGERHFNEVNRKKVSLSLSLFGTLKVVFGDKKIHIETYCSTGIPENIQTHRCMTQPANMEVLGGEA